ncbi:methenyltetrahydrofolate cyclohydrolase [Megasphaera sp. ASD88]|uniref:Methenyltetrahydrofolate cyclohydrolase n=2 Tax=Megasphaera stantonii TaxID=2144175 RepID=A0A346B2K1_9FIRM|nr:MULTISPECIES: cyclodeaminase/cyclohydrolase family protein [Megasphaera]AXL22344.1 methenyltetrahydrofolate cyclohydrolase [Megasphaera stantonii]MCU6713425.1 cyclodeaminase/cyclohydrolase family protein [Megasphaera butyrica]MDN0045924.1 cyclodeaminase/cyclohydrolase family protein [Megasphaera hexanoica]PAV39337.1 methenyltetrahydrofolate cyclohydrolase [Megasphaera sp. ASD88]
MALSQDCSKPDFSRFQSMPLDALLEATASKEPVPGGGGIAAMTAASAAALVEMVANLTLGKKGYEDVAKLMESIKEQARDLRIRYLAGIAEDAAAFDGVIRAVRLPKDTPNRKDIVQQAFKEAAEIPFSLGKDIFVLVQLAEQTVRYGNKWVITDGAIAAMNARSAMRSAFYSVRVNLQSITDEQYVRDMTEAIQRIEREAALLEQRVEREYERR